MGAEAEFPAAVAVAVFLVDEYDHDVDTAVRLLLGFFPEEPEQLSVAAAIRHILSHMRNETRHPSGVMGFLLRRV